MKNVVELINKKRIYFDGGMGSMLQKKGLTSGELPELWSISHPKIIENIHKEYILAGANIITTNTFGVNCIKHTNYEDLIRSAIMSAKNAAFGYDEVFIAFDIGPLGRFLEPIGDLRFQDAIEVFAKNVRVANECGVDLIIIETMTDSYETKAAVIAAKENCDLPIFVTNAYDENGKLLTGADPEAMVALLEGLGVDALGINCSLGPDKMIPLIKRMSKRSSLPIIANPNAGIPNVLDGKAVYSLGPDEFADYCSILAQSGANILGGCCGTEPEYIKKVIKKTKNIPLNKVYKKDLTVVSSYTHSEIIGVEPKLIGERINPTGKPKLKQALKNNDLNYLLELALNQEECGAHILDVNVGLPEIKEEHMLCRAVSMIQSVCDLPLQLDSGNPHALEVAMRIYNGKPLINSVNGDRESMEAVFPLVKKYGGVVIALTLDKSGIKYNVGERVEIANRIIKCANEYGIDKNNIIFDPLALTIATNENNAQITLDTLKALSDLGYRTCLGISNVSFGMPNRDSLNASFFASALQNGLSCGIINPSSKSILSVFSAYLGYIRKEISLDEYENKIQSIITENEIVKTDTLEISTSYLTLKNAIIKGLAEPSLQITKDLLLSSSPMDIINNEIIPALNEIGDAFDKQIIYLPQLLKSAECSSKSFTLIKEAMPNSTANGNSVIIATVKGDIHDIGKNIVKLLLESYGFTVYDLGKDVPPDEILNAAKKYNCKLVALSALMTTTLPAMEETVKLLHAFDKSIKIMVGGAVLTEEYARIIGADAYGKDAMSAVKYATDHYRS